MAPFGRGSSDQVEVVWNRPGKEDEIARDEVCERQHDDRRVHQQRDGEVNAERHAVLPEQDNRQQNQNFVNRSGDSIKPSWIDMLKVVPRGLDRRGNVGGPALRIDDRVVNAD